MLPYYEITINFHNRHKWSFISFAWLSYTSLFYVLNSCDKRELHGVLNHLNPMSSTFFQKTIAVNDLVMEKNVLFNESKANQNSTKIFSPFLQKYFSKNEISTIKCIMNSFEIYNGFQTPTVLKHLITKAPGLW